MAYRETGMWEILEVLRRVHRGEGQRSIARTTGHARTTIRRYVREAVATGWDPAGGVEPDEAVAAAVAKRLRTVPKAQEPGESETRLQPHQAQIEAWLRPEDGDRRGLRLSKVHQLLVRQGVEVPYSSLHRFAVAHCGFREARRVTVRVADVAPGELAEVDFGRLGLVPDPETGRQRVLHALVVTLVHSRHQYVYGTHAQGLADLLQGLEAAWAFFGGVPARVVIDNMRAAVTKSDRYDPIFQRTFAEYAHFRGFVIDAAVAKHPTGKPHVERNVQYVRENFFRGEAWLHRDHVQQEAERWCLAVAGQRVHGTTQQRPFVVFEAVEKPALRPLGPERFDPPQWGQCIVHIDHHIQFGKALYSVPTRYVGKSVWVRADSKLVRVYADHELLKTHPRQAPGGRSTDYNDYPDELTPYALRDPQRLVADARRQGEHVGQFMEKLLAGIHPWAHLRQGQKLLRLANRYGRGRLDAACRRALAFDLLNVRRVETIVKQGLDAARAEAPSPSSSGQLRLLPSPRFLRHVGSFTHAPEEKPHGDVAIATDRPQAPQALGPVGDAARSGRLRPQGEDL